jgi:mannosyltransferase OCH1-like enzyme
MTGQRVDGEALTSPSLSIPRIFHFFWTGGMIPSHLIDYMDSWITNHPDWKYQIWSEDNLLDLEHEELYANALHIAPGHEGQLKSDIARYEILLRCGGVYVDCDFESKRPIDKLLDSVTCFVAWEETGQWLNNAIMGAVPEHPFLRALVDGLPEQIDRMGYQGLRPNVITGPQYLTGVYKARRNEVTVFDKDLFYPYLWNELERGGESFPDAYAVHHWNNKRKGRAPH